MSHLYWHRGQYHFDRGKIFIALKQFDNAFVDFRKMWKLDPKVAKAPDGIAYIFGLMNKPDSCIYYSQKTLELESTKFEAYSKIVKSFILLNRLDSAKIYIEKYARLTEADSSLRTNLDALKKLLQNNRE